MAAFSRSSSRTATSCSSTAAAPWTATRPTSRARRCSASRRSASATCGSSRSARRAAAFKAAQIGATCASVDAAARKVITDAGFGPDYKVPGLPHRTGHGIGLDGHEWTNFVRGNTTKIQPGMCFSDEPMIAIYGEFGIRLEDCLHITEAGPKFFTAAESVDREAGIDGVLIPSDSERRRTCFCLARPSGRLQHF